jgi:hypothetical protein
MPLDRGFNNESIGTKSTTFHGRYKGISLEICSSEKTCKNREGFLTFKPSIEV